MRTQNMQAWQDWAETTVASIARSCTNGKEPGAVTLHELSPVEQPLCCPVCNGKKVQVTAMLFTMPDGRVAYLDTDGLRLFHAISPVPFQNGATMVFRCEHSHVFFNHYRQSGMGTRVTGLAVSGDSRIMDDVLPLWSPPATPSQKEGAHD